MEGLVLLLNKENIDYEIIKHKRPIHTAEQGADYFGIEVGQTAPTLILSSDKGFIALIVAGDRGKIDFKELGEKVGFQIKGLVKPKEVEKITGFKVGAVSMIEHNLPCIIDSHLFDYDYIYGGTGSENHTLKINAKNLKKLINVISEV
ncbi:MAG: YbaK/EbsC family protein [Bacillota bacterium]|nr:YbaK/EbsC family protein [Bacillota bacterium]